MAIQLNAASRLLATDNEAEIKRLESQISDIQAQMTKGYVGPTLPTMIEKLRGKIDRLRNSA